MSAHPAPVAARVAGVHVVKVGGRVQQDPALAATLAAAWRARRAEGGALVVVHGGGDEGSALQRLMGVEPTGTKIRVEGMSLDRIDDGWVAEGFDGWDALGLRRQLGLYDGA